jgi:ADP-ribose pyrophosphatase
VILIEQFFAGPLAAGDEPWVIAAIAGIIEDVKHADGVARREAHEEAGLNFDALTLISDYYSSPRGSRERNDVYCARTDLQGTGRMNGRAGKDEDIRALVLSRDAVLEALASGRVRPSPAIIELH